MVGQIRIREQERDDNLGLMKKEINFPNFTITTPSKSFACHTRDWKKTDSEKLDNLVINEIPRRINLQTLDNLIVNSTSFIKDTRRRFVPNKVNLVIPHLRIKKTLSPLQLRTFSQYLYVISEQSIVLPTVDFSFLKEYKDREQTKLILSQRNVDNYIEMIKNIIDDINTVGNSKPFIGMIPLISIKYLRPLLTLYQEKGINSYIIDAGTKDVLGAREFEFRMILSEINNNIAPLQESFIYATNLGYGLFKKNWTLADDFLSLFAYVDVLGGTFKTRGFSRTDRIYTPRAKIFSRENYVYNLSSYSVAARALDIEALNRLKLRDYNEKIQFYETQHLIDIIGEVNMNDFLLQKRTIKEEQIKYNRLINIATELRV